VLCSGIFSGNDAQKPFRTNLIYVRSQSEKR
jgi:hypothetical protein